MEKKKIKDAIKARVVEKEGKQYITCTHALQIAETLKVKTSEVGKACNEMKIKIMKCQLGCF
jgi:hypothetical protein